MAAAGLAPGRVVRSGIVVLADGAGVGTPVGAAALVGTGADPVAGSADPAVVPPPMGAPATASSAATAMIRIFTAYPFRPRIVVHRVRCPPTGSGCHQPPAGQAL